MQPSRCPLCGDFKKAFQVFKHKIGTPILRCNACHLIFKPENYHPTPDIENKVYRQHQNDPLNPGYQNFAKPLVQCVQRHVPRGSKCLDFGSGKGSAAAYLLEQSGYSVIRYDPVFFPDPISLHETYSCIIASEVFEHFKNPASEIQSLLKSLRPDGFLFVMTAFTDPIQELETWYYVRDPTHVSFYSQATFQWLAQHASLSLVEFVNQRIAIFQRRLSSDSVD